MRRAAAKPAAPPAVVFETRVLLQALLRGDARAQALRQSWQQGRCRPLVCPASARALMLALASPGLRLSAAQQHELLADYLPYATTVTTTVPAAPPRGAAAAWSFEQQALTLARGAGAQILVGDSASLKALFLRAGKGVARQKMVLLGSEEFLAGL